MIRSRAVRWTLLLFAAGCASAPPRPDRDRLTELMGLNDDHKLRIQYRTPAPDAQINERMAAIERGTRELLTLKPFGDGRDTVVHAMAARALVPIEELRTVTWTVKNRERNFRKLEAICTGCHAAVAPR
jgi:hypothetical protein